jgi:uncharacterized protein Smg (DUF494 family)
MKWYHTEYLSPKRRPDASPNRHEDYRIYDAAESDVLNTSERGVLLYSYACNCCERDEQAE